MQMYFGIDDYSYMTIIAAIAITLALMLGLAVEAVQGQLANRRLGADHGQEPDSHFRWDNGPHPHNFS
jgi:hypothetical protein